jgi:hypothetical protein
MDLTLISIVVGLGLTELLLTFYRLVQARRRVTWDALPLAWAALVLIAVVNFWWGIRAIMAEASGWTTGEFMIAMISPVFIFLACAAALPRLEAGEPLDMKTAYATDRTVFIFFFLAYQCGNWIIDLSGLAGPRAPIVLMLRGAATAALGIALAARSRRWDWVAVAVLSLTLAVRLVTQLVR